MKCCLETYHIYGVALTCWMLYSGLTNVVCSSSLVQSLCTCICTFCRVVVDMYVYVVVLLVVYCR